MVDLHLRASSPSDSQTETVRTTEAEDSDRALLGLSGLLPPYSREHEGTERQILSGSGFRVDVPECDRIPTVRVGGAVPRCPVQRHLLVAPPVAFSARLFEGDGLDRRSRCPRIRIFCGANTIRQRPGGSHQDSLLHVAESVIQVVPHRYLS